MKSVDLLISFSNRLEANVFFFFHLLAIRKQVAVFQALIDLYNTPIESDDISLIDECRIQSAGCDMNILINTFGYVFCYVKS